MKTKLLFILVSFFLIFSIPENANGKCRRAATVKYEQRQGWSKKYTVEVTFMTGYELNQASSSYGYNSYSNYAIIFWGQNEAQSCLLHKRFYL